MNYGYFIFLVGHGPLGGLPFCWFAYLDDAEDWVSQHSTSDYKLEIKPALVAAFIEGKEHERETGQ